MSLTHTFDQATLRTAFDRFPVGVVALCSRVGGRHEGMVTSSFAVGISYEPALVSFSVRNESRTWQRLKHGYRLGVSVLADEHREVCYQLASRDETKRFNGLDVTLADSGALFLDRAALWLETSVYDTVPAGDHTIVLLKVHAVSQGEDHGEPIVLHGKTFHDLAQVRDRELVTA